MDNSYKQKKEDMWDVICSEIGFDKKGRELQKMIKEFIKLKMIEYEQEIPQRKRTQGRA